MSDTGEESLSCSYCEDWNRAHPDEPARTACGPCQFCQAPGHLKAHPRQPTSLCLCEAHWRKLAAPGFHFELYHLIYALILALAAAVLYPKIAPWF